MAESTRESGADEGVPGRSVRRRIVSAAEAATEGLRRFAAEAAALAAPDAAEAAAPAAPPDDVRRRIVSVAENAQR